MVSAFVRIPRPDTRLPKSRAGGQGPYSRSPDHLSRSSEVKEVKSKKKKKSKVCPTHQPINQMSDKAGCRVMCMHVSISLYMRSGRISLTQEKKAFLVGEPQSRRGGGELRGRKF